MYSVHSVLSTLYSGSTGGGLEHRARGPGALAPLKQSGTLLLCAVCRFCILLHSLQVLYCTVCRTLNCTVQFAGVVLYCSGIRPHHPNLFLILTQFSLHTMVGEADRTSWGIKIAAEKEH